MMGPPIMTFIEEGKPSGELLRLRVGAHSGYYIIPDDGRDYLDIPMSEMRPYPAFDAMTALAEICQCTIKDLRNVRRLEGIT